MAAPRPRQRPQLDIGKMRTELEGMRNRFDGLSQINPLPRGELQTMRSQLQQMSADLADHVRMFPNQQQNEVRIARSLLNGLMADLDHILNYQQPAQPPPGPQQQLPQRRQGVPVPRRVPAPQRTVTYDVSIGPLPNQRFRLTVPPGETVRSLYNAAVQRGAVVDREFQAGALTLDGTPARPQHISGQIPPAEVPATQPTQEDMLRLLLLHNCFSLPPIRNAAGGDYTSGGGGHIAGFDVQSLGQNPARSTRLDQFRDDLLAQHRVGSVIRIALIPQQPPVQGRKRRGG